MHRVVLLAALVACGDNGFGAGDALAPAAHLVVVAHQDDDLLFMQPDLVDAIRHGEGVTTVYVTAGNATYSESYADRRYEGLKQAYAEAAGGGDWVCGYIDIEGHAAEHCRLEAQRVSLVFVGYPDGGKEGQLEHSLLRLWEGTIDSAVTVAHRKTTYNRDELVETIAEIMRATAPATLHTLDVAATHGRDHSDHMIVAALSLLAMARANSHADVISYRAYNIENEPPNKNDPLYAKSFDSLTYYEACATKCAACGSACTTIDSAHVIWMMRRYAIGFRRAVAGKLRSGDRCLTAQATFGPCDGAPSWRFDAGGELRAADGSGCLEIGDDGVLGVGTCVGGTSHRFFLDDEGHLWTAIPPPPEPDMDYAHLWCVTPTDTGAVAQLCGANRAPTWEIEPHTVQTARADLGLTSTGRELRLGDINGDGKADLCAVEAGALMCAAGDGKGGFSPALQIDSPASPLAIDPRSLALGDVDGDGRVDACGRDAGGILCALAADDFAASRYSTAFDDAVARTGTAASLTALDADGDGVADICGVDASGVVCATRTAQAVRSPWPAPDGVVWAGDLDGDGRADACVDTGATITCAVEP